MNRERRSFILSLALSVGLASSLVAQADFSVTEICAGTFESEGQWAGFNADTVEIDVGQPTPGGTTPARVEADQTFCTEQDGPFNNNSCDRTGRWSFAVGDDFPLDGLGNRAPPFATDDPRVDPTEFCDYRFGPGAFPLSTVGDWSGGNQFCMVVTNCDNNGVATRAMAFTSLGNTGVALQIRTFAQGEETWINPGDRKTICLDFNNAQVEPTLEGGQTVPNTENVTGFAFEFGAYTPFTEQRGNCWDGNKDNNPSGCLNDGRAGPGLNRESDDVCVRIEQPRPQMEVLDQRLVFCNSEFKGVRIKNEGTGTLIITKANLGGADPGEFEAQQTLAVPAGETRSLQVRYNNTEVDRHEADLRFESNALDKDTNLPIDPNDPVYVVELEAFSTLAQTIDTEQNTAISFTARTILHISEHAPTGWRGDDEDDDIPLGCGKVTQITSISSRFGYDSSKIVATNVEIGRPWDEPNGAVSGVETTDLAPLPCCVTDNSDPPLNESVEWQILYNTSLPDANAQERLDIVAGDIGGVVLSTQFYVDNFPLVGGSDKHVLVEAFSADFELLSLTGCNTASVFFVTGPSDNFFPDNHQSNVGHNPDEGTTVLQDVGAQSARSLGIPPNSFVRGDVDFSAQPNANDIVRMADVIFNTDGSEAQVAERIGRLCVAAVDLTVDKSIDIRDLLTLIQLLFNITSNVEPDDVEKLQSRQYSKFSDIPASEPSVGWPGAGYEVQVKDGSNGTKPDPNRFTCVEGLDCDENGL